MSDTREARQLFSTVTADDQLVLSVEPLALPDVSALAADELLIEVKATPISPSDFGVLLSPADMASARSEERAGRPILVA